MAMQCFELCVNDSNEIVNKCTKKNLLSFYLTGFIVSFKKEIIYSFLSSLGLRSSRLLSRPRLSLPLLSLPPERLSSLGGLAT
jgi:hypothetical protein